MVQNNDLKQTILGYLKQLNKPVTLAEIAKFIQDVVSKRTLRRWLVSWVDAGIIAKIGKTRFSQYRYIHPETEKLTASFLSSVPKYRRQSVLSQIRDVWTHSSTAIEGNTFTLGDTFELLEYGLTVSGKPIVEHQEVMGHAKAITLIYQQLEQSKEISKQFICELHKAVQTEIILDIYKPMGDWKLEPNGCNAIDENQKHVYIEYAHPIHVDKLMSEWMAYLNSLDITKITINSAPKIYAKLHIGFVHIHPFWDGNGRLARLLANIPLLRAGLPPLVINQQNRQEYIRCLANYQIKSGKISTETGVWSKEGMLFNDFVTLCSKNYLHTQEIIRNAQ